MKHRTRLMTWLALGAVLALHGAREVHAAETEAVGAPGVPQVVRFKMSAEEICLQASWFPIAIHPRLVPTGCFSPLDSGGFVWLNLPPERLPDARLRMQFLVTDAPAPGVTPFGLLQLNHAIVALLFEQQGIAVALIADNGEILPPPAFFEGAIAGEIAYGRPFELMVHARVDRHHLSVSQDGVEIASARVDKAEPHGDPFTFVSYFNAAGSIQGLDLFFGPAEFKIMKSSDGSGPFTDGPVIGSLWAERVGDAIRVTNPF